MDVEVGAGGHDFGQEGKADGALALGEGGSEGVASEGGGEAVAGGEMVPEPGATFDGGHHLAGEGFALGEVDRGLLLEAADGFAIGSGVGHQTMTSR